MADQAKRKDATGTFPDFIGEYVEAVSRASTDLGRRLKRINIVDEVMQEEKEI